MGRISLFVKKIILHKSVQMLKSLFFCKNDKTGKIYNLYHFHQNHKCSIRFFTTGRMRFRRAAKPYKTCRKWGVGGDHFWPCGRPERAEPPTAHLNWVLFLCNCFLCAQKCGSDVEVHRRPGTPSDSRPVE